ncbi:MAG: hypothetical protein IPK35_09860 [Saprospiraceae bacterium]|nr:hypothetical protein [Saprospiraceae bacterium]
MEIKANDITLQTTITKIPNGNLGIGTGANSIQNRLQIGNPTGFVNNDIAIGNGTQAMSLYQSPTASTFHTNTNFAFMPASGTGNLGIGTDTPTQKLQVLGNIALGNEMYSTATAGLNIVPIGVIKINEIGDNNHNGYYFTPFYTNEVGNLGYGGVRIITSGADDGRIFNIHLNPAITNNYVKVIVIGGAGFNNSNASAAIYSAKAEIVPSEPLGNPAGSGGLSLKIFYYGDNLNYMTPNGTFLIYGIK